MAICQDLVLAERRIDRPGRDPRHDAGRFHPLQPATCTMPDITLIEHDGTEHGFEAPTA